VPKPYISDIQFYKYYCFPNPYIYFTDNRKIILQILPASSCKPCPAKPLSSNNECISGEINYWFFDMYQICLENSTSLNKCHRSLPRAIARVTNDIKHELHPLPDAGTVSII